VSHRLRAVLADASPLVLTALLVVLLGLIPAAIMGLELFRVTHRLAGDEAVISVLQAHDHAEIGVNSGRIDRRAKETEVQVIREQITVLGGEVNDVLGRMAAGDAGASQLAERVTRDEARMAVLTQRIVVLERQGPRGSTGQPGPAGAAGTARAASPTRPMPGSSSACVLRPILLCSASSGR
jgi:hypothetical protein